MLINYANAKYRKECKVATLSGKSIIIESLTPILTQEQETLQRKELEQRLYNVFVKYQQKKASEK